MSLARAPHTTNKQTSTNTNIDDCLCADFHKVMRSVYGCISIVSKPACPLLPNSVIDTWRRSSIVRGSDLLSTGEDRGIPGKYWNKYPGNTCEIPRWVQLIIRDVDVLCIKPHTPITICQNWDMVVQFMVRWPIQGWFTEIWWSSLWRGGPLRADSLRYGGPVYGEVAH